MRIESVVSLSSSIIILVLFEPIASTSKLISPLASPANLVALTVPVILILFTSVLFSSVFFSIVITFSVPPSKNDIFLSCLALIFVTPSCV